VGNQSDDRCKRTPSLMAPPVRQTRREDRRCRLDRGGCGQHLRLCALVFVPASAVVWTLNCKNSLLASTAGIRFRTSGRVLRAGLTLTVFGAKVRSQRDGAAGDTDLAVVQATIMARRDCAGPAD